MKYIIEYDDLLGHMYRVDEFDNLDKARECFKANCYTPAEIYDDFITLESVDKDSNYELIDEYQFTRLDRENE